MAKDLEPGICQTWIWWRGIASQCRNPQVHGDKCGKHGIPDGKPFTRWRVGFFGDPSEQEFVAETADWLIDARGNRIKKVSKSGRYFDTKLAALEHELDGAKRVARSAKNHLRDAEEDLKAANTAYLKELNRG